MAKGTVTGEFVVVSSQVRTGCKRELQFVLKSQSEICGGESLGRTRGSRNSNDNTKSTEVKKSIRGSGLKVGIKKIRLSKNEEDDEEEDVAMSGDVVSLEEDEGNKSDVVDIDESMNGVDNVVMNEDQSVEKLKEESLSVIGREIVLACPANFSVLEKMASRSCQVKAERGLVNVKACKRLTRSMLKVEGIKSGGNADEDHVIPERDEKFRDEIVVDASLSVAYGREEEVHEKNSMDPDLGHPSGLSQMSGHSLGVDKTALNDIEVTPLSSFTRALVKQESDSENPNLGYNTESADVGEIVVRANEVEMDDIQSPSPSVTTHTKRGRPKKILNKVDTPLRKFTEPADVGEMDVHANEGEMDDFQSPSPSVTTHNKRGRPKKFLRSFPAKLKDLLDCGILEGLTVYYLRGAKVREAGTRGLKGVINGSGVLCFCSACKGLQVVSPTVYELHACSTNKRPPEYILLESGCTLRDVMNACKETSLATLEEKLHVVVGPNFKKSSLCLNCQVPMVDPCDTKSIVLCKSCLEGKETLYTTPSKPNDAFNCSSKLSVSKETIHTRSTSSPRQSNRRKQPTRKSPEPGVVPGTILSESKSSSIKSNSQGRLTRKDVRLHKLVFEDDILPDGAEVGYFVAGKKLLVGYKKGFGIHCSCCNKVVSPSTFEAHAGCASRRKPFQHIYTTNGVSLHELSVALSMDQRFTIRENDDLCSICRDGGDLLCCDTCPRSYHKVCASLESLPSLPSERWSCKWCVNMVEREKFVNSNLNAIAAGRVHGVDAIAEITKRCIRIVTSFESELPSVCVLCRGHSFCRMGFNSRTVIICDQCEKEFHVGCLKEHNIADLKELPEEKWFCSLGCEKINTSLGNLIILGEEKLRDNILNFITKKQKPNEESCLDVNTTPDIRWSVLSGKLASSDDTKILLAKAVSILHERFDPISESGTRGDLIPAMVYGRKTKDQDFSGMYCTTLSVDEVIVSVGIFRVFGSDLAELPLVATSRDCQGHGYFQCLFACIERLLGFLNVKHLVLPAADEAKSIWTDKFGFSKMAEEEVKEYRKDYSVMIFHGTSMLRKSVPEPIAVSKTENSMEVE